jgi:gliding motility-associated-like protein
MKGIFTILLIALPGIALRAQNGSFKWARQMGGGSSSGSGSSITLDKWGNVYTTGSFSGTIDFDPGPGVYNLTSMGRQNIIISKLDSSGNFLWAKQMGKTGDAAGASIVLDSSGNIYITGYFNSTVDFDPGPGTYELTSFGGDGDIFVIKLDAAGNFMWAKQMGGIYGDQGFSIALDKFRNIYITGEAEGEVDFDPGPAVYELTSWGHFVSKLDNSGNLVWAKIMSATGFSTGRTIALDVYENVYTTGWFGGSVDFDPGPGNFIMNAAGISNFVLKLNSTGNFIWARQMGGSFDWDAASLALDPSGNIIITGTFGTLKDFDPGPGEFNLAPVGTLDIFVSKFDENGNFLWAKQIGGPGWEAGNSIITDAKGNSYLTGWFGGTVDFDPGPGIRTITSYDVPDIFVSVLDENGNFLWAKQMGGPGPRPFTNSYPTSGNAIALDVYGNVYTTGSFNYTVDFDPELSVFNLSAFGEKDIFVHKMSRCSQSAPVTIVASACGTYTFNGQDYDTTGVYTQTYTNSTGCDSLVILQLTVTSKSITEINKTICQGENYAGYTTSGVYADTLVSQNGCDSIIALNLTVLASPSPDLGADKNLCLGDSLVLKAGNFNSYVWQDGSVQSSLTVRQPGLYSVIVTDDCGTGRDEILVKETACNILFPSAFTPNNDGKNDLFKALGKDELNEFNLVVFDRWGQKVFSTNDFTKGWDGHFKGKLLGMGVYAWYCTFKKTNTYITKKGTVLLIR